MKKFFALFIALALMSLTLCSCRSVSDTKPKNDTTTPNPIKNEVVL